VQIILSSRGSGVRRHPDRVATRLVAQVRPDLIVPLLPAAVTVAMLAAIESLLSAVVADSMSGDRHNSNVELLAQGRCQPRRPVRGRNTGYRRDRLLKIDRLLLTVARIPVPDLPVRNSPQLKR
jgi:hypothetical protein